MPYKHRDCGGLVEFCGNPHEPPDPDRYGNRSSPYKCAACGERFTVTWLRKERRHLSPEELIEIDDRGVAPDAVCTPE